MTNNYRPNIILINIESIDGRKMGCMGNEALKEATPHLDRMAEKGVMFKNAYANCPVCNPSRASMWSGKYPHYYNCWNNHEGLKAEIPTFMDRFEETGYITQTIGPLDYQYGKHSIRDRVGSWTRAANIHRPLNSTSLPRIVEENKQVYTKDWNRIYKAINWVRDVRMENNPFMLYLTTDLVHPGFIAQRRYVNRIKKEKIEIPPQTQINHPALYYQQATKNALKDTPEKMIIKIRSVYLAMIATLDQMLGELFKALAKFDLEQNTYIIITGDHGEMAMEHGQVLKRTMYEPSIHVPLIIKGPELGQGQIIEKPVSLIDIFPTLMDMGEIDYSKDLDGESLISGLKGDANNRRDWVLSEYHGDRCNTGTFMLVKDNWKYINYVGYEPVLFDLEQDPDEINNLAPEKPEVVKKLDEIMKSEIDCESIDKRAKKYDKREFLEWRKKQKEKGTYEEMMSLIYSGYQGVSIDNIEPWTAEDEKLIEKWLNN